MKLAASAILCLLLAGSALSLAGCEQVARSQQPSAGAGPAAGKQCTVQFRRDALGVAANHPIGPQTRNSGGGDTFLSGTLVLTSDQWVVVKLKEGAEAWVPRSSVLLLEVQ